MEDRFKFRAKRKDNNEWICGTYFEAGIGFTPSAVEGEFDDIASFISENNISQSSVYSNSIPCPVVTTCFHLINEETLGQCTGLKDKNGKLIYEGDILEHKFGLPVTKSKNVVFWDRKHWHVGKPIYTKCCNKRIEKYFTPCGASTFKEFYEAKIIGNIHENRELLEKRSKQ